MITIKSVEDNNIIVSREVVDLTVNVFQTGGSSGKLEKEIIHTDLTSLTQSIGTITEGSVVSKIVVEVTQAFETQMTIGSMSAQGILTTLSDVNLAKIGTYTIENFVKFSANIALYAFFAATSTTGNLKIIIFYS